MIHDTFENFLFGDWLRYYRKKSHDPDRSGSLTQERLAELVGAELGTSGSPSPQMVSYWEKNKYTPDVRDRLTLTCIVKILVRCGGIVEDREADLILEAGGYAPLTHKEKAMIFDVVIGSEKILLESEREQDTRESNIEIYRFAAPHIVDFIGRSREMQQLRDAFNDKQIVALIGLPGVGKTCLAARYAAEQSNSRIVCWLDQPGTDIQTLAFWLTQFLQDLGDRGFERQYGGFEEEYPRRSLEWEPKLRGLIRYLGNHPCLIVMDNFEGRYLEFEPLLASVSQQMGRNVQVLLVNRPVVHSTSLRLFPQHVRELVIGGLTEEDMQLYIASLREANNIPPLDQEDTRKIYNRTDGCPLAINLTLLWIARGMPPHQVVEDFSELDRRSGSGLEEHLLQSVLPLLTEAEKQCMTRLAVFRTSIHKEVFRYLDLGNVESIEQLARLRLLTELTEDGQVQVHGLLRGSLYRNLANRPHWHSQAGQYYEDYATKLGLFHPSALLEAIWHYRLSEHPSHALDAANKLVQWLFQHDVLPSERLFSLSDWLRTLTAVDVESRTWLAVQVARIAEYDRDFPRAHGLLKRAIEEFRSREESIGVLTATYYQAKLLGSQHSSKESLELFEIAFGIADRLELSVARVRILRKISDLQLSLGNRHEALQYSDWALEISRANHDLLGEVLCLYLKGNIARKTGDFRLAESFLLEALSTLRPEGNSSPRLNDSYLESKILCRLGIANTYLGELGKATEFFTQSVKIKRQIGDKYGLAIDLDHYGDVEVQRGDYEHAQRLYLESRRIKELIDDEYGLAKSRNNLGYLYLKLGEWTKAAEYLELLTNGMAQEKRKNLNGVQATMLSRQGELLLAQGSYQQAISCFVKAARAFKLLNTGHNASLTMLGIGRALLALGFVEPAKRRLEAAMAMAQDCGYNLAVAQCYSAQAQLAIYYGDLDFGIEASKRAQRLLRTMGSKHELLLAQEIEISLLHMKAQCSSSPDALLKQTQPILESLNHLANELTKINVTWDADRVLLLQYLMRIWLSPQGRRQRVDERALKLLGVELEHQQTKQGIFRVLLLQQLQRLRALGQMPEARADFVAQEGLQVFGPLATVVGMAWAQAEIEDRSFERLQPNEYEQIRTEVDSLYPNAQPYLEELKTELLQVLSDGGVKAEVTTRLKHIYSIHEKLKRLEEEQLGLESVLDLVGARVIVRTQHECYEAEDAILSKVGRSYGASFLKERRRDYIFNPKKDTGYESLHLNIQRFKDDRIVELQIRTYRMHQEAETGSGAASHFAYKTQGVRMKYSTGREKQFRIPVEFKAIGHERSLMEAEIILRKVASLRVSSVERIDANLGFPRIHQNSAIGAFLGADAGPADKVIRGTFMATNDDYRTVIEALLKLCTSVEDRVRAEVHKAEIGKLKGQADRLPKEKELEAAKTRAQIEGHFKLRVTVGFVVHFYFSNGRTDQERNSSFLNLNQALGHLRDTILMVQPPVMDRQKGFALAEVKVLLRDGLDDLWSLLELLPDLSKIELAVTIE